MTDSAPELQRSGSFALVGYLTGSTTIVPMFVRVDNLLVRAE